MSWSARLGMEWQPRPWWAGFLGAALSVALTIVALGAIWVFRLDRGDAYWLAAGAAFAPGLVVGALVVGAGRWPVAVVLGIAVALLLGACLSWTSRPVGDTRTSSVPVARATTSYDVLDAQGEGADG